jgi:tRNA (uracil-5-)-methyltransferase TRM9
VRFDEFVNMIVGYTIMMKDETAQKLIAVNKTFYDKIGKYWNNSVDYTWDGWVKLIPHIQNLIDRCEQGKPIKVLDIGAGNGRWYHFLKREFPLVYWDYTGVDISAFGKETEVVKPGMKFVYLDVLFDDWTILEDGYDLVVSMGLIHHIPGERLLEQFFKNYTKSMKTDALGILTTWQYMRLERLRKRITNGTERQNLLKSLNILESELREGDNFLEWVKTEKSIRFSHYFETDEVIELLNQNPELKLIKSYLADDREQNRNEYFVVKKVS